MVRQVKGLSEFNQVLADAGDKPVLVDFHAVWCGPCKMIAPEIDKFATQYPGMIFIKVDVDESEDVSQQYDIEAMPSFKVIKNKQVVDTLVGANVQKLEEMIKKHCK